MHTINLRPASGIQSLVVNENNPDLKAKHFIRELFAALPHDDIELCASFIGEIISNPGCEDLMTNQKKTAFQRIELNETTKQKFVRTMQRVTQLHEGISRRERNFIQQFWSQISKLH